MEQIAVVVSIEDGQKALVRYKRMTSCGGNCTGCSGCEDTSKTAVVLNAVGAQVGQNVKVEIPGRQFFTLAFLAYIFPIAGSLGAYFAAELLSHSVPIADFAAIGALFISFFLLRKIDKLIAKSDRYQSRITKILG